MTAPKVIRAEQGLVWKWGYLAREMEAAEAMDVFHSEEGAGRVHLLIMAIPHERPHRYADTMTRQFPRVGI